jgi:hypothetical protein
MKTLLALQDVAKKQEVINPEIFAHNLLTSASHSVYEVKLFSFFSWFATPACWISNDVQSAVQVICHRSGRTSRERLKSRRGRKRPVKTNTKADQKPAYTREGGTSSTITQPAARPHHAEQSHATSSASPSDARGFPVGHPSLRWAAWATTICSLAHLHAHCMSSTLYRTNLYLLAYGETW